MRVPAAKIYFSEEDRKKILKQVDEILESGQLTLGKYTREFKESGIIYIGIGRTKDSRLNIRGFRTKLKGQKA